MSFLAVRAGIHARLLTIPNVSVVIAGMPDSIHAVPPLFITQFQSGQRSGQTSAFHWRFLLHAVISNQANTLGEQEVDAMVDAVYAAFSPKLNDSAGRNRATLGGVAAQCFFEDVRSGETDGYLVLGTPPNVFRRIGFVLVVKTLEAY